MTTADNSENRSVQRQLLIIEGSARQLEIIVEQTNKTQLIVAIICHPHPLHGGSMNNKVVTTMARTMQELGWVTVRFNFRGVGNSAGSYGETIGETDDLLAVRRWVKNEYPHHQICLAGFSFGAFIAAKVAARKRVKQLISIAPPVHHFDFVGLATIKCPWLIVQGELDEIVPAKAVKHFVVSLDKPPKLILLAQAGHFFHGQLLSLREILRDYLLEQS